MKRSAQTAVSSALIFKLWQATTGVITILVIANQLDPASQGFYYTFASLIALQSFFELGLYLVISISASHEWAKLDISSNGQIVGDRDAHSRLVSLGRFVFKWYGVAALLFLCLAGTLGFLFLARQSETGIEWQAPWLLHVAFAAVSMWLSPFLFLLEGCDQVASTSRFRLLQSILSNVAFWVALAAGLSLWAVPVLSAVALAALVHYLLWIRRQFFATFFHNPVAAVFSWRLELLPMQWRLAVQGLFTYLSFPLYTTLAFAYLGAAEAGRLGMSLQVVSALQSISLVMVMAKGPQFAMAVANSDRLLLDREWKLASTRALCTMAVLTGGVLLGLHLGSLFAWTPISRILAPTAFGLFAAASLGGLLVQCMAVYLRAHKRERLTAVGVVAGILYGALALAGIPQFGSLGVAATHFTVTVLLVLPPTFAIFFAERRRWNTLKPSSGEDSGR